MCRFAWRRLAAADVVTRLRVTARPLRSHFTVAQFEAKLTPFYPNWALRSSETSAPLERIQHKLAVLNAIALVNVKKIRGLPQSTDKDLSSYALENAHLLRREVEACKPRVIICGGTFKYLKDIFTCQPSKANDHWYYRLSLSEELPDVLVIDYYHPQSHHPALLTYYGIANIYQQFLKENESHAD